MITGAHVKMKWQDLERLVRAVAEVKFGATARAEDIAGVKCDCVIHLSDGSVVLIEISKEDTLPKLRMDLAKFNTLRPHFFQRNIFPKCYFITSEEPTPALIEAGKSNYVTVYSALQFFDAFLGLYKYAYMRTKRPFGSAVNLYSGEPDQSQYVSVTYAAPNGEDYTIEKISAELISGRKIVLLGDYGAGKSRCIKELFETLITKQQESYCNPISINLRENWGLKRAQEILTRHFTDLGLSEVLDQALKVSSASITIYLLDGFDEVGAQAWSDDPTRIVEIRKQSLVGIKDLVVRAAGGVIIAGREHYFNNDEELITCLGLEDKNPLFLRCNPQLTNHQFFELLGQKPLDLPLWMPKKPLIATIVRDMNSGDLEKFLSTSSGEIDFWNLLIDAFCKREAEINPILDAAIIRALFTKIGRLSRSTKTPYGPISIKKINDLFEQVTGRPPTDESAIVLQRLPGLSRIEAESLDRQFADSFILEGLKAEDVLDLFAYSEPDVLNEFWVNPLEEFGAYYVATRLEAIRQESAAAAFIKRNHDIPNRVLISDLLSALFLVESKEIDFNNLAFSEGKFSQISLSDTIVRNLQLYSCQFDYLDISEGESKKIIISHSIIARLAGITSGEHAPNWLSECLVDVYQTVETLTAIREAGLTVAQTFLLSSLRKLFLQPGGGRQESSMYKGYGNSNTKKTCEKVIQLLLREGFCVSYKGANGALFVPDRALTERVKSIMSQMTTSKDNLWLQASRIE